MKKFTAFLLLAIFTLLMGLMFISCGSRKSVSSNTELKITEKDTVSEISKKTSTTEVQKELEEKSTEKSTKKEISAEVKDGETLQVDEFDKDGNHKGTTIFKGSGKVKIKEVDKNKVSDKTATENKNQKTTEENITNASSEAEQTIDFDSKKRERTSETDLYLGIGFLLFVFFLIWRLKSKEE